MTCQLTFSNSVSLSFSFKKRYGVFLKTEKYEREVTYFGKGGVEQKTNATRNRSLFFTVKLDLSTQEKKTKLIEMFKAKEFDSELHKHFLFPPTESTNNLEEIEEEDNEKFPEEESEHEEEDK